MSSTSSREGWTTNNAAKILDAFHEAAASSNEEAYFSCFSPSHEARFLGSDGKENWTVDEFRAYAKPHFAAGNGWVYKPIERKIDIDSLSESVVIACFDEHLSSEKWGRARGTGVLTFENNTWKILQYHLSFPIPNELANDMTKRISQHRTNGTN